MIGHYFMFSGFCCVGWVSSVGSLRQYISRVFNCEVGGRALWQQLVAGLTCVASMFVYVFTIIM
jgi:hypothetical protein